MARVVGADVLAPVKEYVEFCAKADTLSSSALKRVAWLYMIAVALHCLKE